MSSREVTYQKKRLKSRQRGKSWWLLICSTECCESRREKAGTGSGESIVDHGGLYKPY